MRPGTIDGDFRWLSSLFNWGRKHKKPTGERLLRENPLHDVTWIKEKEKNQLRPVASHDRYVLTQHHTDAVDPTGGLRCGLALARYTASPRS